MVVAEGDITRVVQQQHLEHHRRIGRGSWHAPRTQNHSLRALMSFTNEILRIRRTIEPDVCITQLAKLNIDVATTHGRAHS